MTAMISRSSNERNHCLNPDIDVDVHEFGDPVPARAAPERLPLSLMQPADSPRLEGEDEAHIARLASADAPLPPILVRRSDLRVIDGMHRLRAAVMRGRDTIEVEYFHGDDDEAFVAAVRANIAHGLPLTKADRVAAAARIVAACPHMSDRAVAAAAGLSAATVAGIRKRTTDESEQLSTRMGQDGRVRPVDPAAGRLRAARMLAQHPGSSLRAVARGAGVSAATVRDVRDRLARGESPVSGPARDGGERGQAGRRMRALEPLDVREALGKLMRDPALRQSDQGRQLLRWLQNVVASSGQGPAAGPLDSVPPHAAPAVAELIRSCASALEDMALHMEQHARKSC